MIRILSQETIPHILIHHYLSISIHSAQGLGELTVAGGFDSHKPIEVLLN